MDCGMAGLGAGGRSRPSLVLHAYLARPGFLTLPELKNRVAPYLMGHTSTDEKKLLGRVRRLKGQLEAIERALENKAPCGEILNLVASVRGAVNGLTVELIEDHIREHVSNPETDTDEERAQGAADLLQVVRTYLK